VRVLTVIAIGIFFLSSQAWTQQKGTEVAQPGEQVFQVVSRTSKVKLVHLDTRILELEKRIRVVEGFDPAKLSVTSLSPHRVRLQAEGPGVTTVKLIDEFDKVYTVEVFIEPDTRELQAYLERLFPGSAIEVVGMRDAVVLRGWVTEPTQIPQIIDVAEEFYPTVHPQLQVGGVSQVQLHVKVMEVQRTKLRELGVNFAMLGEQYFVSNSVGSLVPLSEVTLPFGGPPSIVANQSALRNAQMQFGITGNSHIFQGMLEAMQTEGLAKVLAEPVLVTTSGRPASMLSGGEFPVPVPQGLGTVGIQWKEFGVRMEAVPIVLGNGRLRLDISPEVSERDFANAQFIGGELVTGVFLRRVNTQVEMRFGETLMIGGLISSRRTATVQKVPFLGELPWIGAAFSRKRYDFGETELVILVTPQMASPMAPHQVPPGGPGLQTTDPVDRELYFDGLLEVPALGPECPDCEPVPVPGMILPEPASFPHESRGAEDAPPLPPPSLESANRKSTPGTGILQTAGRRLWNREAIGDVQPAEHQEPDARGSIKSPRVIQSSPSPRSDRDTSPKQDRPPAEERSLPGLIEP
jgi:pilus assembly protein CpaC